jgi:BASS family bile acid:Na+ symporter
MDGATLGILAVRCFVVVTMASFGLQVAGGQLTAVLRRPALIGAVLVANLVLMPLAGVGLALGFGLAEPVALGLVITACAAGSTYSAKLVEVAGGDIRTGISLMFLLAIVTAIVLGPVAATMVGLLGSTSDGGSVALDPVPILVSLVLFQVVPLLGLMALHRWRPSVAARLRTPAVRLSTVTLGLAFVAVLVDSGDDLLSLGLVPVLAMVALIGIGLAVGYAVGGEDIGRRRATALITGQRSASVAYIAVQGVGLPLATATVVAFAFVMLAVNLGISLASRRLGATLERDDALRDPSPAPG